MKHKWNKWNQMKHKCNKWNRNETNETKMNKNVTKMKPSVTKWNLGQCSCFSKICLPNGEWNPQWSAHDLVVLRYGMEGQAASYTMEKGLLHCLLSTLEELRSINWRIPSTCQRRHQCGDKTNFLLFNRTSFPYLSIRNLLFYRLSFILLLLLL